MATQNITAGTYIVDEIAPGLVGTFAAFEDTGPITVPLNPAAASSGTLLVQRIGNTVTYTLHNIVAFSFQPLGGSAPNGFHVPSQPARVRGWGTNTLGSANHALTAITTTTPRVSVPDGGFPTSAGVYGQISFVTNQAFPAPADDYGWSA